MLKKLRLLHSKGWQQGDCMKRYLPLLMLFFLLPSISAVTLTGAKLSPIIYEPGKVITNHYVISGQTTEEIDIVIDGALKEYVSMSEIIDNEFDLLIEFPEKYLEEGTHDFSLAVEEIADPTSGAGAVTGVALNFMVEVYSMDKVVYASLITPDISEGEPLPITLTADSRTYQNISLLSGIITVYDDENVSLGEITTDTGVLPALGTTTLQTTFDASSLTAGEYSAKALVIFDGLEDSAKSSFKVGARDVTLVNYTSALEQGFGTFSATVSNEWGKDLENVYLKLFVNDEEMLQTPTGRITAWGQEQFEGIARIDLPLGLYDGNVEVYYDDDLKIFPVSLEIVLPGEKGASNLGFVLLIVLGAFIVYLIIKRRKKK